MDTNSVFEAAPKYVVDMAREIIMRYPEQHEHLRDLFKKDLIGFYFRKDLPDWAGKCKKCSAFERQITGKIILIFLNYDWWALTTTERQYALLDHELCHIGRKDDKKEYIPESQTFARWNKADDPESWFIVNHDVEEFAGVVERHGLWDKGIEKIADACAIHERQITLGEFIPVETSAKTV